MATICAKALNRLNATMLSSDATRTWAQAFGEGMRKLRRIRMHNKKYVTAPSTPAMPRMVSGGISLSAIFITGQVMPQIRPSTASIRRAPISPCGAVRLLRSGFLTELSVRRR